MRREDIPVILLLLLVPLLYVLFKCHPQLDTATTAYFYNAHRHHFDPLLLLVGMAFKRGIYFFNDVWIPLLIAGNAIFFLNRRRLQWLGLSRVQWLFLFLVMALGPGISVNVAKNYFHRPRPIETVQFGGTQAYVAPLERGTESGQSFFSGHATSGFYFCAFGLIERRHRKRRYAFGLLLGSAIGLSRIMMGAHFLSDILFSAVFMLLIMHLLLATAFRKLNR